MFRIIKRRFLSGAILSCFLFSFQSSGKQAIDKYSKVVTFGDSLMDSGNVYNLTKDIQFSRNQKPLDFIYDQYGYWNGRSSD